MLRISRLTFLYIFVAILDLSRILLLAIHLLQFLFARVLPPGNGQRQTARSRGNGNEALFTGDP